MNKKVFIYANITEKSKEIEKVLRRKLVKSGLRVYDNLSNETELIFCIGGDGTLLTLMQEHNFPKVPVVGINTGHLGFFQEVLPERIDDFIFAYNQDKYTIQNFNTVTAIIKAKDCEYFHKALNEIAVKGQLMTPVHLNISINDSFIERFSGDGICVSTPAGSTAYNYSLGGSIVDPRLKLLQVAPIAPMKSMTYRSFTSSILLPSNDSLTVIPCGEYDKELNIVFDGKCATYKDVEFVKISLSNETVNLIRFEDFCFWDKVKCKFL